MRGAWRSALAVGAAVGLGCVALGGSVTAKDNTVGLRAHLAGTNEVPPVGGTDPDSTGEARVKLDTATGEVCFDVRFSNTGTPTRAHIHAGAAGVNGGIVVPLIEPAPAPTDPLNDQLEKGRIDHVCATVSPAVVAQIVANPGGYYVNLHNARFPGGATRGQLSF